MTPGNYPHEVRVFDQWGNRVATVLVGGGLPEAYLAAHEELRPGRQVEIWSRVMRSELCLFETVRTGEGAA